MRGIYWNEFQFQTGSIKSSSFGKPKRVEKRSFNSKLVRLKANAGQRNDKVLKFKFQFQTGSIKRDKALQRPMRPRAVSIPNWFD